MEKNIKNKVLASILVFVLILANFQGIIAEGINVYASSIENQTQETNHKNVDFNAQFMVINTEKQYSIRENIQKSEIYLNIFTEVKDAGYLKSGRIEIKDEKGNDANFNLVEIEEPNAIQSIDYARNEIVLNQINNGEIVDVNIPIKLITDEIFDLNNFSKNIVVTFTGVYVDEKAEEKDIKKEIKLKAEWKEEVEAVLTQETVKVLPYELEEIKGLVVSEKVSFGIVEYKLPIKLAKLDITVPEIDNVLPTEVRVENENTSLNVAKEYKDGRLSITLENSVSENNTIIWNKSLEELRITYIFENIDNSEVTEVQSNTKIEIECYSSEKKTLDIESQNIIDITNKLGSVIEGTTLGTETIQKGYMLNTTNETEFTIESNIDVAYEKLVEEVEVTYSKDKFVIAEKAVEANTNFKKLTISKENFNKILGEAGEIKIYSQDTLLGIINGNSQEENIVFNFENDLTSEIKIETTKPIYSGILKIEFLKAIKGETGLSKDDIKNITNVKLETLVNENVKETSVEMQNPTTKIGLNTNTNILSTVVENMGVEFTVILNNNSLNSDLFKNPKVELRLPEDITDVRINSVQLLLEDELKIENYEYVNETNSIMINLTGVQTKYNLNDMAYGATIIVNTDITLDKLAVNKKDKVELFVVNETVTSYESVLEEKGYSEKDINIVAPLGLIAINSAEGYTEEAEETVSMNGNEAVGKIEPNAETKVATMTITAINNYEGAINNIRVLGRVPFIGNKSLIDGSDLGTTFDAILKGKIVSEVMAVEQFDIYYSENGEATEDLENESNGWVLEVADFSKIKSYLIVLKDYELLSGEKIEFKYDIEVPADLEVGNSAHGTYIVYYDNKKDDVVFENTTIPTTVELTTGEAPKLEVSINSNMENNQVARSGQIVKYSITVKNVGEVVAEQVFVTSDIPEELTYAELVVGGNYEDDYYNFNTEKRTFNKLLDNLEPGEEQTVEYLVRVNENVVEQKEIKTQAKVSAKNLPEMIESSEIKNTLDIGSIMIELKSNIKEDEKVKVGDEIEYTAKIKNTSSYDINNSLAVVEIPDGLTYKNAYIKNSDRKVSHNDSIIEFDIGKIEKYGYAEVVLELIASNAKGNTEIYVKASGENINEHKSNVLNANICESNITVKQESTIPEGYVSIGDKIEYKIEVTNTGDLDATNIQIIDLMPEGMKYVETSYELKGTSKTIKNSDNNETKLEINVPANETVKMSVKVKADETDKEMKATNIVKVINDGTEIEANKVTHIIEAQTLGNSSNGENNNNNNEIELVDTYKISGTAWLDSNENGQKDDDENILPGITVMLLDKNTGNIAKDANEQDLNTTTEGTGVYTFRNLKPGEYIVVFIYDNAKYMITDYKKSGVDESKNSDVANIKINMNEEEKTVAVSDALNLSNENIYNINIGLKEIGKFDLKLNKYINKITVNSSKGATTYDYKNTDLAKIEINSKIANGSTLVIEYKIAVTNEGSIEGYAKKIVDYIPAELKFSSELNSSWYLAEDGNVYSSELANTKINPGETKEVTLILTKQITGENTGLINNNAEIVESYNDYGLEDTDSTAGNKQSNEEDMSNADIYIGIKTGSPVTYIGLSLVLMIILAAGAYLINVKVLIKN